MRIQKTSALASLLGCLFLYSGLTRAAENAPPAIAQVVDATIPPLMKTHDIPGMAIAVVANGRTYFFNYGFASKQSRQPVTQDTLFELGSISKTFTGILGGYALSQGKLSLSDTAGSRLPALQGSAIGQATLLQLATYTAGGLPLQFPDAVNSGQQAIGYYQAFRPAFAAGERRLYSNPSIGLFGYLAAQSLGQPFDEAMEKTLLPKLGLSSTYIRVPASRMERYAWGYARDGKPVRVGPGAFDSEAYGIKSSAADMAKYMAANWGDVRDADLRQALDASHAAYYRTGDLEQGLGWEGYRYPVSLTRLLAGNANEMAFQPQPVSWLTPARPAKEAVLLNKTGSTNGFGAYVAVVPSRKIAVVMLANRNYPNAARVTAAYRILAVLDSAGLS
ncbi:class C beta-lactamase [Chromobacterium amazonense]|uniref:Beta-lactamase n=1 Tax=Chromobacterium amazonense TaxID=1382803 RepID=A0ABU8V8M1_9NEIS|nr:class C beta-lactamase [Chromobacterium amazonense]MDQ4539516.1 class C beta-lactamase [Chromobacterium amazonense]